MKTIHKLLINQAWNHLTEGNGFQYQIPVGSRVVLFQEQNREPHVWYEFDDRETKYGMIVQFLIVGTGHRAQDADVVDASSINHGAALCLASLSERLLVMNEAEQAAWDVVVRASKVALPYQAPPLHKEHAKTLLNMLADPKVTDEMRGVVVMSKEPTPEALSVMRASAVSLNGVSMQAIYRDLYNHLVEAQATVQVWHLEVWAFNSIDGSWRPLVDVCESKEGAERLRAIRDGDDRYCNCVVTGPHKRRRPQ